MSERRDQNDVGISWIDNQRADLAAVSESDIFPGLARIDRFVNADSVSGVAANGRFTGAGVNDIVIRRRDRDCANRRNIFLVEKRRPILATVHCFPNAAGNSAEIIGVRFPRNAFNRERATAAERSDLAPLHPAEQFLIDCAGWSRFRRRGGRFRRRRRLTALFRRWTNRKGG